MRTGGLAGGTIGIGTGRLVTTRGMSTGGAAGPSLSPVGLSVTRTSECEGRAVAALIATQRTGVGRHRRPRDRGTVPGSQELRDAMTPARVGSLSPCDRTDTVPSVRRPRNRTRHGCDQDPTSHAHPGGADDQPQPPVLPRPDRARWRPPSACRATRSRQRWSRPPLRPRPRRCPPPCSRRSARRPPETAATARCAVPRANPSSSAPTCSAVMQSRSRRRPTLACLPRTHLRHPRPGHPDPGAARTGECVVTTTWCPGSHRPQAALSLFVQAQMVQAFATPRSAR